MVVRDTVSEHGTAVERTFDFYAQDKSGDVWYMGENSLERRHGRLVRASDSWKSGVHGAKPGIIMRGHPRARSGLSPGVVPAGQARVLGRRASLTVPAAPSGGCS